MEKNINHVLIALILMIIFSCISGCTIEDYGDNSIDRNDVVDDGIYFKSDIYSIGENGLEPGITWIWKQAGKTRVVVTYYTNTSSSGITIDNYLYSINSDGSVDKKIELLTQRGSRGFCPVGEDRIACSLPYGGFILYDIEGNIVAEKAGYLSEDEDACDAETDEKGFVILSNKTATLYDYDGNQLSVVTYENIGTLAEDKCYFESNNESFIVTELQAGITTFTKIDFENRTYQIVKNSVDYGIKDDFTTYRYGGYSVDIAGDELSKLDMNSKELIHLASFNNMNIPPLRMKSTIQEHFFILDDENYAYIYKYDNGLMDVVLISRDNNSNANDRQVIVIKGNGVTSDPAIQNARYIYNSSQSQYYIKTYEWGNDYFYSTVEGAQSEKLKLINDFEKGLAPDMFYGCDFDYNQFGESGMTEDILKYINPEDFDDISDSVKNLMINNNHCYQVFSGYTLYGLIGNKNQYSLDNYSINNLPELYSNQHRIEDTVAYNICDYIVRYEILNNHNTELVTDKECIKKAVQFSLSHGKNMTDEYSYVGIDTVINGSTSLCTQIINNDIREFETLNKQLSGGISYIGFPSFEKSNHPINPSGLLAISSSSKYPEACADFIKILLSYDSQKMNYLSGAIPVNETVLTEYLDYMKNPKSIPDNEIVYKDLVSKGSYSIDNSGHLVYSEGLQSISIETINRYRDVLSSVDTLINIDWGIYIIIKDEISSFYTTHKKVDEISDSLSSRLDIYIKENY